LGFGAIYDVFKLPAARLRRDCGDIVAKIIVNDWILKLFTMISSYLLRDCGDVVAKIIVNDWILKLFTMISSYQLRDCTVMSYGRSLLPFFYNLIIILA